MSVLRSGKYFYICSEANKNLVLETDENLKVRLNFKKEVYSSNLDNQLWCRDDFFRIINKKNQQCLIPQAHQVSMSSLSNDNSQRWKIEENKIISQVGNLFLEKKERYNCTLTSKEDNNPSQKWKLLYLPALYFYIQCKSKPEVVMDVKKDDKKSGAKVILYQNKHNFSDNQLWFEDQNGFIRNKMNDFVLEFNSNKEVIMKSFTNANSQRWHLSGNLILNKAENPILCLTQKSAGICLSEEKVMVVPKTDNPNNECLWSFHYLPHQSLSLSHIGWGKNFLIIWRDSGEVLEVTDDSIGEGSEVSLVEPQPKPNNRNLFFQDETTGTIKSLFRGLVLEVKEKKLKLANFDPYNKCQQWLIKEGFIMNRHDLRKIIVLGDKGEFKEEISSRGEPHWQIYHVPAKCFHLESYMKGKVMDVQGNNPDSGIRVILYSKNSPTSKNQLWYEDEAGLLRSKLNGYIIDASDSEMRLSPFDPDNKDHYWCILGDRIVNKFDNKVVIDVMGGTSRNNASLIKYKYHGGENQKWKVCYLEE